MFWVSDRSLAVMTKRLHCRVKGCSWTVSMSLPFEERMAKLRRHRKRSHPTAHKKSVRKAVRTKKRKGGL